MSGEMNVRDWKDAFNNGEFDANNFRTQCRAGWYDWFCNDSALARKTQKMGRIISRVTDGGKINFDTMYVWFKNNCPCSGPLYDDLRFADIETGNTIYTITIDCYWDKRDYNCKYAVYGRENDFKEPLAYFNDSRKLTDWLNAA